MLSTVKRGCIDHSDNICYICGEYIPPAHHVLLNSRIKYAYKHYFECQVDDQDKKWVPHICCNRCRTSLLFWLDGKPGLRTRSNFIRVQVRVQLILASPSSSSSSLI